MNAKGDWDYRGNSNSNDFNDFTQLNYGATGTGAGYGAKTLLVTAGALQAVADYSLVKPSGRLGTFSNPAYGDDPVDQYWIKLGILYHAGGEWKK